MYRRANTQAIRDGAYRFAVAADEMRQRVNRIVMTVAGLREGSRKWEGVGANAFDAMAGHLQEDATTAGFAFEQTASILQSLASQLDRVNELRQEADHVEQEMYALEGSLWGADDQTRSHIQHQLSHLRYRHSSLVYEADSKEYQANQSASISFHQVSTMIHRLHVYDTLQNQTKSNEPSLLDQVGHFFNSLWDSAVQKVDQAKQEGGVLGGFVGFIQGAGESIADLLEVGWKMTPEYPIYSMMFHPDEFKEKVTSTIYEYTHPIDTFKSWHPLDKAKVIFNSVKTSIDHDLLHGNSYTRAKWVGYAAGVVGTAILTDGETAVARGATAVEEVSETATVLEATTATSVEEGVAGQGANVAIDDLVKRSSCSSDDLYKYLKVIDANSAERFLKTGKWPEDEQIPKGPSVLNANDSINWNEVPNGGYVLDQNGNAMREVYVPKAGEIIDRYGPSNGRYTSPVINGEPYSYDQRSLPYVEDASKYHQYEVTGKYNDIQSYIDNCKDLELKEDVEAYIKKYNVKLDVYKGEIASGFGAQGGGIQYQFPLPVDMLEDLGYLRFIK